MITGSGNNGELTFLDAVSLASFLIGVQNLDMNLTQDDKQDIQHTFDQRLSQTMSEVHNHLEIQDKKLDMILKRLEDIENGYQRDLHANSRTHD